MKKILFAFLLMLFCFEMAISAENKSDDAKSLSGISIVGNKETPKSLFIVPWKSSEIGFESTSKRIEFRWIIFNHGR